jgi:hypothetical protein
VRAELLPRTEDVRVGEASPEDRGRHTGHDEGDSDGHDRLDEREAALAHAELIE